MKPSRDGIYIWLACQNQTTRLFYILPSNTALTTEASLDFIKQLGTRKAKGMLDNMNIIIIPMYNADEAMGDVNYELKVRCK